MPIQPTSETQPIQYTTLNTDSTQPKTTKWKGKKKIKRKGETEK